MSYAGHVNLITPLDFPVQFDGRLKRMLATSLVAHAVLLFGLMSVQYAPIMQHPLAAYHVDLVTLPYPEVTFPREKLPTVKQATSSPLMKPPTASPALMPVSPKTAQPLNKSGPPTPVFPEPSSAAVVPVQAERVTQAIVDAVKRVVVPESRKVVSMANASSMTMTNKQQVPFRKREVVHQTIPFPAVPQLPQLSARKGVPKERSPLPSAPSPHSFAKTLKQVVQSVVVPPQKPEMRKAQIPSPLSLKSDIIVPQPNSATAIFPSMTTLSRVPQLAKVTQVPTPTEIQPRQRPHNRVSDSLKHVVQSVKVPEIKKSHVSHAKEKQAVPGRILPLRETPTMPRKELEGIVMPSKISKLAEVERTNVWKSFSEKPSAILPQTAEPDALEQKIAKLVIPNVQVLEAPHSLGKPAELGGQHTATILKVSDSSLEGHSYWARVWSKIDREWIASRVDIRSGEPVRVVLAFRVERTGTVKNLAITQPSGNDYYDLAAKRAVLNATPLPPFAATMPELYYDMQFQFTINMDSY